MALRPVLRNFVGLSTIAIVCMGCGGQMKVAPVSGVVTLDGEPLPRASVTFQPQAGGRPSFGVTDQSGRYSLAYSMHETGAEVGACTVRITTKLQADEGAGDGGKMAPEKVPARYVDEPLTVTVEPKSNKIDLALKSP